MFSNKNLEIWLILHFLVFYYWVEMLPDCVGFSQDYIEKIKYARYVHEIYAMKWTLVLEIKGNFKMFSIYLWQDQIGFVLNEIDSVELFVTAS